MDTACNSNRVALSYAIFKWASAEARPARHYTGATFVTLSSESPRQ